MPQTPGRLGRPTAGLIDDLAFWRWLEDFLPEPSTRTGVAVAVPLAGCLVFAGYALAVALAWRWQASRRGLVGIGAVAVVLMAIGALAFPNANTDIFSYIASGRVAAVHDANPYEYPPASFPNDPLLPYVSEQYSGNLPSKLPAFMLVNVSLAELPGDDPVANLLAYRFAFLALSIASLVLLVLAARRLFPGSEAGGLVLYGWNPVVAAYGQSKTDVLMVFFLLLAAYLYARGRERSGLVALGLSALVKLISLPLVVLTMCRDAYLRRWRALAVGAVILAAVVALVYLPFADGPGLLVDHLGLLGAVESADGVNRSSVGPAERFLRAALSVGFVVLAPPARDASGRLAEPPRAQLGDRQLVLRGLPDHADARLVPTHSAGARGGGGLGRDRDRHDRADVRVFPAQLLVRGVERGLPARRPVRRPAVAGVPAADRDRGDRARGVSRQPPRAEAAQRASPTPAAVPPLAAYAAMRRLLPLSAGALALGP